MLINVFERVPGHGEDDALCVGGWAAAVFDGLGGLGGRPLRNSRDTEARAAARRARDCLRDAISSQENRLKAGFSHCAGAADVLLNAMRLRHELEVALDAAFLELGEKTGARTLPTNCACVLRASASEGEYAICLWAGDARAYLLDRNGLAQLTRDDNATGADAFEDLRGAAPAAQTARLGLDMADGPGTHLGLNVVEIGGPAVLLACSDGVYSPYRSPMHLELMLWRWLGLEPDAALPLMDDFWDRRAQDDCSLVAIDVPAEQGGNTWTFTARERVAELYARYIRDFPPAPGGHADAKTRAAYEQALSELWAAYKPGYERLLPHGMHPAADSASGHGTPDPTDVRNV